MPSLFTASAPVSLIPVSSGNNGNTVKDKAGRVVCVTYPDGSRLDIERDASGQAFSVVKTEGSRQFCQTRRDGQWFQQTNGGPEKPFQGTSDILDDGTVVACKADGSAKLIYHPNGDIESITHGVHRYKVAAHRVSLSAIAQTEIRANDLPAGCPPGANRDNVVQFKRPVSVAKQSKAASWTEGFQSALKAAGTSTAVIASACRQQLTAFVSWLCAPRS
jgi:hypothetical protein